MNTSDKEKNRILNLHESYRNWNGSLIKEDHEYIADEQTHIESIDGYNKTIQVRLDNYIQGWNERLQNQSLPASTISRINELIGRIGTDIDILNGIVRSKY